MLVSPRRFWLVSAFLLLGSLAASAQQTGTGGGGGAGGGGGGTGGTGTGGTGTGGTGGSGGSSIGAPSATGAGGALDADVAFSNVSRSATVGATGSTGGGFSAVSDSGAAGGGGGGLGGFRGLGGGGLGGLGGLSSLFGGLNSQSQTSKPAIRTRMRSAVAVQPRTPAMIELSAGMRFRNLVRPEMRNHTVTMEGRKGVITGVVSDERTRRMSELLLRLEPGVREVENRLQVVD